MRQTVISPVSANESTGQDSVQTSSDAELLRQFAAQQDEGAFERLVRRHGPMVQGVCRRILGDAHDAEDAFQAVFLVLARKSASIRRPDLLANWLYGVACRIARKARIRAIRREIRERQAGKMATQSQLLDLEWVELKAVLDDELSQLPEKYRAPLVLCYLRGQTNAEAAAQLGWPTGSISERLSRAREMLRKRLSRRGMNLSAALLALLLSQKLAAAGVSPSLVKTTVVAGLAFVGKGQATEVSASVVELANESRQPTLFGRLTAMSAVLVIAFTIAMSWSGGRRILEASQWLLPESVVGNKAALVNGVIDAFGGRGTTASQAAAGPMPTTGSCCHCSTGK